MAKSKDTTNSPRVKPIIFSAPMVRALLEGRKAQTRWVIKPLRAFPQYNICRPDMAFFDNQAWFHGGEYDTVGVMVDAPYGFGDLLWVREAWGINLAGYIRPAPIPKSCPEEVLGGDMVYFATEEDAEIQNEMPRCPSLFMPRWASRLTLRVTNIRAERLQDISEADARAEGANFHDGDPDEFGMCRRLRVEAKDDFRHIWEALYNKNNPKAWHRNPWVWVYEFEVIQQNVGEVA